MASSLSQRPANSGNRTQRQADHFIPPTPQQRQLLMLRFMRREKGKMWHFIVPACLCLLSLSVGLGTVAMTSRDSFSDITATDKILGALESMADSGVTIRDKSQSRADAFDSELPLDNGAPRMETADLMRHPEQPTYLDKAVAMRVPAEICDLVADAARSNGVPASFLIHLLFQESRFRADAVSSAGAQGIAQFMPETAAIVGLDNPFDPMQAIPAAARLLRDLAQQFGNYGLAAAAYNAGPKRIHDWLTNRTTLPTETVGYVRTITGRAPESWMSAATGSPALRLPPHAPCQQTAGLFAWNESGPVPLPPARPAPQKQADKAHNDMLTARAHASKREAKVAATTVSGRRKRAPGPEKLAQN
jgi:hypothetical protein